MIISPRLIFKWLYIFVVIVVFTFNWVIAFSLVMALVLWNRFFKIRIHDFDKQASTLLKCFTSPVHGTVQEILEMNQKKFIKVKVGIFDHKGIYAMDDSIVDHVDKFEKATVLGFRRSIKRLILRAKYRQMQFSFYSERGHTSLSVMKSTISFATTTMLMPGDRVSQGAHIGWIPIGGIVLIELPNSGKLLIEEGQKLKFFRTILMEFEQ